MKLNGGAREIGSYSLITREMIEKGAFPTIGLPHQDHFHETSSTKIFLAIPLPIKKVPLLPETIKGPKRGALLTTFTTSPGRMPYIQ
jgi:hypothetical protein